MGMVPGFLSKRDCHGASKTAQSIMGVFGGLLHLQCLYNRCHRLCQRLAYPGGALRLPPQLGRSSGGPMASNVVAMAHTSYHYSLLVPGLCWTPFHVKSETSRAQAPSSPLKGEEGA